MFKKASFCGRLGAITREASGGRGDYGGRRRSRRRQRLGEFRGVEAARRRRPGGIGARGGGVATLAAEILAAQQRARAATRLGGNEIAAGNLGARLWGG
ncbi:unnamed protein product [Urochloa humidicola]